MTTSPATRSEYVDGGGQLGPVPDGWSYGEIAQFLYREARLADENDYDGWEALWTDDALYWVPSGGADVDPPVPTWPSSTTTAAGSPPA